MMTKTIGLTSYFVKNSSSYSLYKVMPFFWDGENVVDDFDLGNLSPGYHIWGWAEKVESPGAEII